MNYLYRLLGVLGLALTLAPGHLLAQAENEVSCENSQNVYFQNFGNFAAAVDNTPTCNNANQINWLNNNTVPGWYVAVNNDVSTVTPFNSTDGSCNLTGMYNAPGGIGARTLGSINHTGTNQILLRLTNTSNTDIIGFEIQVFYAQFRRGRNGGNPDRLRFQWGRDISAIDPANDPFNIWTNVAAMDYTSPETATAGPVDPTLTTQLRTTTVNFPPFVSIPAGDDLWFRWIDEDLPGGDDDGLGITQIIVRPVFRYLPAGAFIGATTFQACNSPGSQLTFDLRNTTPFNPADPNSMVYTWSFINPGPVFVGPAAGPGVSSVTVDFSNVTPGTYTLQLDMVFEGNLNIPGSCWTGQRTRTITVVRCGPIDITCVDPTYAQDFDNVTGMPTTNSPNCAAPGNMEVGNVWFNDQTVPGWRGQLNGLGGFNFNSSNGHCGQDGLYWYGNDPSGERAFGALPGNGQNWSVGARFRNLTGNTVNDITIGFTAELWRRVRLTGTTCMRFEYSTDATAINDAAATWNAVTNLDACTPTTFAGPPGPVNGNLPANREQRLFTITIPGGWANNTQLWIRWSTDNAAGGEDGIGIDDFFFIAEGVNPTPPTAILGPTNVCPNDQVTYRVDPPNSCFNYAWTAILPVGATYVGPTNQDNVTINWGTAPPGVYTVRVSYGLGTIELPVRLGACGPIPVACNQPNYEQNFNTVTPTVNSCTPPGNITWTDNGTVEGWYRQLQQGPDDYFFANDGSCNTGGTYFYGPNNDPDRAFGTLRSNNHVSRFGVNFVNANATEVIRELTVRYVGEQWRRGDGTGPDRLVFEYSTDATSLSTGTWTGVPQLDFQSPYTGPLTDVARDGNDPANRAAIAFTITGLNITPGQQFWFRWNDINIPGTDDGLAVDDFELEINATPPPITDILGPRNPCVGSSTSYTAIPQNNAFTFTWSPAPAGASYTTPNPGNPITIDWGTAVDDTYTLEVTASNACGTTAPFRLNVDLGPCGPLLLSCLQPAYGTGFDGVLPNTNACSPGPSNINWVDAQTIRGWYRSLVSGNDRFYANDGNCAGGATYLYGASGDADRALGTLQTGDHLSMFGVNFQNDAPIPITDLIIEYTGEQWRRGNSPVGTDRLIFEYSLDATALDDATATWIPVAALDFIAPYTGPLVNSALNGNDPANQAQVAHTITGLNILPNQQFWLRWTDFNTVGFVNDGLAIDNFNIIANTVPMPTTLTATGTKCEGSTVLLEATPPPAASFDVIWENAVTSTVVGVGNPLATIFTPGNYDIFISIEDPVTGCNSQIPPPSVRFSIAPQTVAGNLTTSGNLVCYNDQVLLTLNGFTGDIVRWLESTDNFATETPILFTGATLTPAPNIRQQTCYEVEVKSGECPAARSNRQCIDVSNTPGTLSSSGPLNACFGQGSGTLTLSGFTGNVLRWEASTDNFVNPLLTTVINQALPTLNYTNLEVTTSYRAVVGFAGCPDVTSPPITINVLTVPGTLSSDVPTTLCSGEGLAQVTLTGFTGNVVRWEISTDNFATVAGTVNSNAPTLPVANITQNQCYRPVITAPGCAEISPTPICFTVQPCAPVAFTCQFTDYFQDFNTLTPTTNGCGTPGNLTFINNLTLPSWYVQRVSGTQNRTNADDGSCDQGGAYSYGTDGSTDRALGTLRSGTAGYAIGARFRNNTGGLITQIRIDYTGEQWRRGNTGPAPDQLRLSYSTDPATTSLTTGTWTPVIGFDFNSPFTLAGPVVLNGNAPANREIIPVPPIPVAIPNGQDFWIRWEDPDLNLGNDGLAIEDVRVRIIFQTTIQFVPQVTNVLCRGQSTGGINIRPLDPNANYTYQWDNNVPPAQRTQANVTNLPAGNYTVTITDVASGCTRVYTETIGQPNTALSVTLGTVNQPGCNSPVGSITLNVSGGTPGYTYLWSNGSTAPSLNNLPPDIYSVTVTDANGCRGIVSDINLFLASPIIIDAPIITGVTCNGASNGAIALTVTGGQPPLTYAWSNGANTASISGLAGGVYTVTVTDDQGCRIIRNYTVPEPGVLTITVNSVTNVRCNGGNDGSIGIDLTGGTAPYTIQWSNLATQENISGLTAGTYQVNVTDARGCSASRNITVGQPNPLTATIVNRVQPTCHGGSNGQALVQVNGGTPGYTFLWNSGETTAQATNLRAGTISVDVFDRQGCRVTATSTLGQPTPVVVNFTDVVNVSCNGFNNGVINVQALGGTPSYTFRWNDGPTISDRSNLAPGTYTLTVTDQQGCTAVRTATITQPNALTVNVAGINPIRCNGDVNGSISFEVFGGTLPYTYTWTSNSTNVSTVTGPTATGLAAGTYTLTVRDARNCQASRTVVLDQPQGPLTITLNFITPVRCAGGSDGQVATTISGGTQPYSISWIGNPSTEDGIVNVPAGTYTIRVTDANGCTAQQTYTVPEPSPLNLSVTSFQNVSCPGGNDGAITVAAAGGNGGYAFAWAPGSGSGSSRNNLTAGSYFITVRDQRNCVATVQQTLTQPDPITIVTLSSITQRNPSCNGGSDGLIDVTVFGGTPGYTYEWRRGATFISSAQDLVNVPAGSYTLTVRDSRNCTQQRVFQLVDPAPLTVTVTQVVNPTCNGDNNGSALLVPSGGNGPYTYLWSNGWTGSRLTFAVAGTYTATVTDASGCTVPASVTLTQPAPVSASVLAQTNVLCRGQATGSFAVAGTGGTPVYTYQWSNGATTANVSNLTAGIYSLTIIDSRGCRGVRTDLAITQPASFVQIIPQFVTDVQCGGQNNGAIAVEVTGGTPPYTFQWNDGPTTEDRGNLAPGEYTLVATDNNGCTTSRTFEVGGPTTALTVEPDFVNNITCHGQQNGAISVTANGGTRPYTYRWSHNPTTQFVDNLRPGAYAVTVTDANGCAVQRSFTITEPQPLTVSLLAQQNITCRNGSSGSLLVQANGGTGPYTYRWSNGGFGPNLVNLPAGFYSVVVSDQNNCLAFATYTVVEQNVLTVSLASVQHVRCFGETNGRVTVSVTGGVAPYSYIWNGPPGNQTINNVGAGTYTVLVSDNTGCTVSLTQEVLQPAQLVVTTGSKVEARCNGASNGALGINVNGGVLPYTFAWSNGSTTEDLNSIPAGTYTVTVTDANGCRATHSDFITQPDQLAIVRLQVEHPRCHNSADGVIAVTATGGTASYRYNWSGSLTQQPVRTGLAGGTYGVTVTDARGCRASDLITLTPPAELVIDLVELRNTTCKGRDRGIIDIEPRGGTPPYTYWWSTSSAFQDLINVPAGTYTVNVVDAKGCSVFRTFTIQIQPNANATISGLAPSYCANAAPVTLSSNPVGGTFSGPGVTGNQFDPAAAGPGTHTIVVDGTFDGCPYTGSTTVRVDPIPSTTATIAFSGSPAGPPFCASNTSGYLLTYTPPQTGVSATFSGRGVINGPNGTFRFVPVLAGSGSHTLTAVLTNSLTGCSASITRTVQVDAPDAVTVSAEKPVLCNGESTLLLATGGDTYTWAPTIGLSCAPNCSNVGAVVTASPTQSRTYTVTARRGGCALSATVRVEVRRTFPIAVSPANPTICESASTSLTASSSTPYTYEWAPNTNLSATTGRTVSASPTATTTYTVTGSFQGCTATQQVRVTVEPATVAATANPATICQGQSTTLSAATSLPGNFSYFWSPPAGLSSAFGQTVTARPNQTTVYTVTRSGSGSCRSTTVRVEVTPVSASIDNLASDYCVTSPPIPLVGTPEGGTFTGPGVANNVFNPAAAGPGLHVILYSGTLPNGCAYSVGTQVVVGDVSAAVTTNILSAYCALSPPVSLSGQPAGGTFSGPGVVGNTFNPQSLTPNQTYTLTYSGINPQGNCPFSRSYEVEIRLPEVAIQGLSSEYCLENILVPLTGTPAGGTFSGPGIVNGRFFNPSAAGTGSHFITYFGFDGACTYSTTVPVRVFAAPTLTAVASAAACSTCATGSINLTAAGGLAPYLFSIDGGVTTQSSGQFNGLLPGTYSALVFDARGCEASASVVVPVSSGPAGCVAPTILSVEPGQTAAQVNFTPIPSATGYVISWRRTQVVAAPWVSVSLTSPSLSQFVINNLLPGTGYEVRIRSRCGSDLSPWSPSVAFQTQSLREALAATSALDRLSVYPNPSKGDFVVDLELNSAAEVDLTILDASGRVVETLRQRLAAGSYQLPVQLRVAAGMYLLRISIGDTIQHQKLLIH